MPFLPFLRRKRNLSSLSGTALPQVLLGFIVLLFSFTVHELAHAWVADRLGDPTGRLLGRITLNPMAHADLFGTVLLPLIGLLGGGLVVGWVKPVPVQVSRLRHPRRDFALVALAGPVSNLLLALVASLPVALAAGSSAAAGPRDRDADEHFGIPQVKFINERIAAGWSDAKIKPSDAATDQEWCRRVHLDIIGRIPTSAELDAYVADSTPTKRAKIGRAHV